MHLKRWTVQRQRLFNSQHLGQNNCCSRPTKKQSFIAQKQSLLATSALAGHCERVHFSSAKNIHSVFSVKLPPKSTILLLPLSFWMWVLPFCSLYSSLLFWALWFIYDWQGFISWVYWLNVTQHRIMWGSHFGYYFTLDGPLHFKTQCAQPFHIRTCWASLVGWEDILLGGKGVL